MTVNLFSASLESEASVEIQKGRKIILSFEVPKSSKSIIVDCYSDRNKIISKISDVSKNNPKRENPGTLEGKDIWFPVIDLKLENNLQAIAVFENVGQEDEYCWNGNFYELCGKLENELYFNSHLEHWENQIFIRSETASLKSFFLRKRFELGINRKGKQIKIKIGTLSEDWSGEILLKAEDDKEVILTKKIRIEKKAFSSSINKNSEITKDNILVYLKQTIHYILDKQNLNPLSPTYGGLYLFYDLDAKTNRRSDWIWTYGPAIKLLLEAARIPELAQEFGYETLLETAKLIGEASLRFLILDKGNPAYGLAISRFDPRMDYPQGSTGYASPADSHFLAGWGWIPLYEATGDRRFLEAAILQGEQIGNLIGNDGVVEQDYILKIDKWKNWTMDESAFGMIGFSEVYKHTIDKNQKDIAKKYIDGLMKTLEAPDGLWYKNYNRNQPNRGDDGWPASTPSGVPQIFKDGRTSRGNGWVMIGLLAAHQIMPDENYYLKKGIKVANNVINFQFDDGAFPWILNNPSKEYNISEKGTPLWSMLLFQLYDYTNDPKHLEAAQKALQWCMENQYSGDDQLAQGGIVGESRASGIVYRFYYPLVCTYTMEWFGLALLEQLNHLETCR